VLPDRRGQRREAALGDIALVRVEIGTGEVAGDRRPAARQLAIGVEPGKKEREVALSNPVTLGMELLECLRELVAELLDRPIRDRPAHPAVVMSLLRQPLLLEQAAVLVFATAAAWTRCVWVSSHTNLLIAQ